MPNTLIDLQTEPKYALEGKIVTMNDDFKVIAKGIVYIENNRIYDVKPSNAPPPQSFENIVVVHTEGTIFPGLIELHNHLCYDILPMWNIPKKFDNRDQWKSNPDKARLISGPMQVLAQSLEYMEAIIRYVECKCLFSGVTASQGITLMNAAKGTKAKFKGMVRNVEATDNADLPDADARIADVEAKNAAAFLDELVALEGKGCELLHLSEGIGETERAHFLALKISEEKWAITNALAGIHCVALEPEDFEILKSAEASIIWSPFSNYLLYGQTANIKAARDAGVLIGLGSDWSPTGSKNLLSEMKVAHLISKESSGLFSDKEIISMATRNAAKILKWEKQLGTIERDKIADLIVIDGRTGDPYKRLINATETAVKLVIIDGIPKYGKKKLMEKFKINAEKLRIGKTAHLLNLQTDKDNPISVELTLKEATSRLKDALSRLSELSAEVTVTAPELNAEPQWFLSLDQDQPRNEIEAAALQILDYTTLLKDTVIELDPLTVVDDESYCGIISKQTNLPDFLKTGLPLMYGVN